MAALDRTTYFMEIARAAAARSTCPRASVGAVLTLDNSVIATGYNGAPKGLDHCDDEGCVLEKSPDGRQRCIRTVHAELNALLQGLRRGSVAGSVLYVTHSPCLECAKAIINAGVGSVVFDLSYHEPRAGLIGYFVPGVESGAGVETTEGLLEAAGVATRWFHDLV